VVQTAPSTGRSGADTSVAVAELALDQHAGEHAHGGERRRRGADRASSGRGTEIRAVVAELELDHAGELDHDGDRRQRGADRAELDMSK